MSDAGMTDPALDPSRVVQEQEGEAPQSDSAEALTLSGNYGSASVAVDLAPDEDGSLVFSEARITIGDGQGIRFTEFSAATDFHAAYSDLVRALAERGLFGSVAG